MTFDSPGDGRLVVLRSICGDYQFGCIGRHVTKVGMALNLGDIDPMVIRIGWQSKRFRMACSGNRSQTHRTHSAGKQEAKAYDDDSQHEAFLRATDAFSIDLKPRHPTASKHQQIRCAPSGVMCNCLRLLLPSVSQPLTVSSVCHHLLIFRAHL